ncbi:CesT family type III secretion system chaperone [Herbaspirillum sp. RV1423]|uniref:CesT family type III secretion system chaperone n=1 Tax=Herbaspirillum sp. RV1423 TaxID=1443993 RepID=UPI0004B44759|nr:CesT family type III secretion system chaperone [Herbaspirillum sp. RV1423]
MSKAMFIELAANFCRLAKLQQPEKLLEGQAVEVDGVTFHLGYDEDADPENMVVYCDFGQPPQDRLLNVYEALLEVNLAMYGSHAPAFMLSPSRRVALGYHYRLGEVVPEQLLHLISNLAAQAKDWREHYFLSDVA